MRTKQEYQKRYLEKNPETRVKTLQKYNNKKETKLKRKVWIENNKERCKEAKRRWYLKNKEKVSNQAKEFAKNNPEWKAAHCAKRRSIKLNAIPKWIDLDLIEEFYNLARTRSKVTGIKWHVDHIVPLNSKTVCGLHIADNLQVIPSSLNSKKGNREIKKYEWSEFFIGESNS